MKKMQKLACDQCNPLLFNANRFSVHNIHSAREPQLPEGPELRLTPLDCTHDVTAAAAHHTRATATSPPPPPPWRCHSRSATRRCAFFHRCARTAKHWTLAVLLLFSPVLPSSGDASNWQLRKHFIKLRCAVAPCCCGQVCLSI